MNKKMIKKIYVFVTCNTHAHIHMLCMCACALLHVTNYVVCIDAIARYIRA